MHPHNESKQIFEEERDISVSSNFSCGNKKLNTNLLAWQIATGCLTILLLFYCGLRECFCNDNVCSSDVVESIEFCEKITNICMCCKEICCTEEEEENTQQRQIEIPVYETRSRKTELPQ